MTITLNTTVYGHDEIVSQETINALTKTRHPIDGGTYNVFITFEHCIFENIDFAILNDFSEFLTFTDCILKNCKLPYLVSSKIKNCQFINCDMAIWYGENNVEWTCCEFYNCAFTNCFKNTKYTSISYTDFFHCEASAEDRDSVMKDSYNSWWCLQ